MSFKKYLLSIIILLPWAKIYTQPKVWNLGIETEVARFFGSQVYETDSFYYVVGTSVDEFGMVEQGFSVSKLNKKDASVIATIHYEESGVQFDFNQCRKGILSDSVIIFPLSTSTLPASITLFKVNIHTLNIEKLLSFPPPDSSSNYTMYLNDFIKIEEDFYTSSDYSIGKFDTPSFKNIDFILKFNIRTKNISFIQLFREGKLIINQMCPFNNGLLIFGTFLGTQVATGKMAIYYLNLDDNVEWEYQTPSLSPIHDVRYLYPLNEKEVLLASYDSFFSSSDFQVLTRWTVTRYDVINKKIVWSNFWNEPRKPNIKGAAKIVKSKKDNEYLLMANDKDSTNDGIGKVVKFNGDGQRLWQKTYDFTANQGFNDFNNIIQTSENNYLIVGRIFSVDLPQAPWLVKIDEDGNILPIDTTSSTVNQDISQAIPEIKVYPNPASHSIIINQGEIAGMTYQLIHMSGAVVKTLPMSHAHHNTIWDISDMPVGNYIINMLQDGKVIGTKQVVIIE